MCVYMTLTLQTVILGNRSLDLLVVKAARCYCTHWNVSKNRVILILKEVEFHLISSFLF